MTTTYLIDKSAITSLGVAADADGWGDRIDRGLVRISTITLLEVGFSARSADDHQALLRRSPIASMPIEYVTPTIEERSVEVQSVLAGRGQHRAPSVPDLVIAATAELAQLTLLHVEKDFELIADVTGQPIERLELA